jgi:hypothetical protein
MRIKIPAGLFFATLLFGGNGEQLAVHHEESAKQNPTLMTSRYLLVEGKSSKEVGALMLMPSSLLVETESNLGGVRKRQRLVTANSDEGILFLEKGDEGRYCVLNEPRTDSVRTRDYSLTGLSVSFELPEQVELMFGVPCCRYEVKGYLSQDLFRLRGMSLEKLQMSIHSTKTVINFKLHSNCGTGSVCIKCKAGDLDEGETWHLRKEISNRIACLIDKAIGSNDKEEVLSTGKEFLLDTAAAQNWFNDLVKLLTDLI